MKTKQIFYLFILVGTFVWSCKKDDGPDVEVIPPRSLSEVAVEDEKTIQAYLKTHFYNYEEFENASADFDYKIVLDTISGNNASKISLFDDLNLKTMTISVSSSDFGRDDDEVVNHELYYLIVRQGVGDKPTYADNVILRYEGSYYTGKQFDASSNTPSLQYLPQTLSGYRNAIINFKTGLGPVENGDGTVSYNDYGVGLIFIPSGLGYFNRPPAGSAIPQYSPLIFKVDILSYIPDTDFDNDGIPSIMEDLNGNGNLNDDNTDVETETQFIFPNHIDSDDDNDGTPTRDEIIIDGNGNITFPDTDGDGTPDYLDPDNS